MKLLAGLLAFILAVNVAVSLPAHSPQDDAEVIGGPRRVITNRNGFSPNTETDDDDFRGVITSDVGYPFLQTNPHAFSFNWGYFDALNDILRRLKAHLQGMDSGDSSAEPAPGFGLKDQPEVNSTSTVKVVDGHKIEINDTYYGDENSLFKVRLVQIRPLEEDENPVEGTINSDGAFKPNPSTSRPETDEGNDEETREPLAKNPNDNEINGGNIDDPEKTPKAQSSPLVPPKITIKTTIFEDSLTSATAFLSKDNSGELSDALALHKSHQEQLKPETNEFVYWRYIPTEEELRNAAHKFNSQHHYKNNNNNNNKSLNTKKEEGPINKEEEENQSQSQSQNQNQNQKSVENFQESKMEKFDGDDVLPAAIDEQATSNYNAELSSIGGSGGSFVDQDNGSGSSIGILDAETDSSTIENNEEMEQIDNLNESAQKNWQHSRKEEEEEQEQEQAQAQAQAQQQAQAQEQEQEQEQKEEVTKDFLDEQEQNNGAMQLNRSAFLDERSEDNNENQNDEAPREDGQDEDEVDAEENQNENKNKNKNGKEVDFLDENTKESLVEDSDIDEEQGLADVENIENLENDSKDANIQPKKFAAAIQKKEREHLSSSSDDEEAALGFQMNPTFKDEWSYLTDPKVPTNDGNNELNNDIDVYDTVPIDLSNDLNVNQWAASQAEKGEFPLNPDAEFFQVDGQDNENPMNTDEPIKQMPMFEELSISSPMHPSSYQAMPTHFK